MRTFALVQPRFLTLTLVIIGDSPALEQSKALARTLQIENRIEPDDPHRMAEKITALLSPDYS